MVNNRTTGSTRSIRGSKYERQLSEVFSNWPQIKHPVIENFLIYLKNFKNIVESDIKSMKATTQVTSLPSGGPPKTDIILKVFLKNKSILSLNISCKKTSAKSVTFHEYSADDFINVLNIKEERLKQLIYKHQEDGSAKFFSDEEKEYFKQTIQKYKIKLWEWVILGKHGSAEKDHIVDIIITNDKVYLFQDFVNFLSHKKNGFNTGLSWTRQSRGKSRTIQLKGPVLGAQQHSKTKN